MDCAHTSVALIAGDARLMMARGAAVHKGALSIRHDKIRLVDDLAHCRNNIPEH